MTATLSLLLALAVSGEENVAQKQRLNLPPIATFQGYIVGTGQMMSNTLTATSQAATLSREAEACYLAHHSDIHLDRADMWLQISIILRRGQ